MEVHRPARRSPASARRISPWCKPRFYFGLSRPAGKDITAEEWQQFVDRDVTPRFRDGLTVFDAHGQWLGQNGQVVREQSKALMVIHGHDAQSEAGIEALRQGYKSRFAQESVMRVDQPVCVQF
ncbi:30S ribosomal protein S3 [Klebsiella pneumoniae]|uniref:30S ribosomal protein S3 n=1 Tax=Klebsiella pneumoniae TaxID=573 RepID=A0A2X3H5B5_KLEPN|nr:30S ribosomal protein S3 [Klebsiella pneumoniae]